MTASETSATHDEDTVLELIRDQRTALLTTVHADSGSLVMRPMSCLDSTEAGTLWFLTETGSDKALDIAADPRVNVGFVGSSSWVSLSGTAQVMHDPAKNRELWNEFAQAWFQCEPEDPKVSLIRVEADSAEYWDAPGAVGRMVSVVKAKVSGERPDMGENETVEF